MEFKNRRFNFFGDVWAIKYVDHAPLLEHQSDGDFNGGVIMPLKRTIYISTKWPDGKPISEETIKGALRHELSHLIFLSGQYLRCYEDEPLVEWVAKSLGVFLNSHII